MILISMDEGGKFEQLSGNQCNMIGGVVYQCEVQADAKRESDCLASFFKTICTEQQCRYPYDLHYNWKDGIVVNGKSAEKVKKALALELPDYLKKQGRWTQNRPANGQYYVFCMVGDSTGLDSQATGNIKDSFATIRYDHMIYRTVENLLFYNPRFENEKKFDLQLPTRVIDLKNRHLDRTKLEAQLTNLGYRMHKDENGKLNPNLYEVTDATSYRAYLESALLNSDKDDLDFRLRVNSIYYEADRKNQRFLYLADTLCSVYQDAIQGISTSKEAISALSECGKKLTGEGNTLLWAYHQIDKKWHDIWNNYRHGNWFDALKDASEIQSSRGALEKAYQSWINCFEEVLTDPKRLDLRGIRALEDALSRLDDYMQDMQKRQQTTGLYIIKHLKKCQEGIGNENIRGRMDYSITKILTSLYNHRGNYKKAEEEYKKCMEAARYVTIEEYLGVQLLHIVSMCDAGEYEKAEKSARIILAHHELISEIKDDVHPDNKLVTDSYGRALSQHGQTLTLLRRYDEAAAEFHKALDIFKGQRKDWLMTGSFMLHTLIDQGDKQAYSEFAKEYFGSATPRNQFRAIMDYKCGNVPFALYVFLKGLWVFGGKETEPETMRKIIEETLNKLPEMKPEHPLEQVLKYCAFLWYRYFETKEAHNHTDKLMEKSRALLQQAEGVLKAIKEENDVQYSNVINGVDYMSGCKLRFTYC